MTSPKIKATDGSLHVAINADCATKCEETSHCCEAFSYNFETGECAIHQANPNDPQAVTVIEAAPKWDVWYNH